MTSSKSSLRVQTLSRWIERGAEITVHVGERTQARETFVSDRNRPGASAAENRIAGSFRGVNRPMDFSQENGYSCAGQLRNFRSFRRLFANTPGAAAIERYSACLVGRHRLGDMGWGSGWGSAGLVDNARRGGTLVLTKSTLWTNLIYWVVSSPRLPIFVSGWSARCKL